MSHLLNQIKAWRQRWDPRPRDEHGEDDLNKSIAAALSDMDGKRLLDYLIENYLRPVDFIGAPSALILAERNGQQKMLIDILSRVDMGLHPMLYKESPSTEDEREMDPRQ